MQDFLAVVVAGKFGTVPLRQKVEGYIAFLESLGEDRFPIIHFRYDVIKNTCTTFVGEPSICLISKRTSVATSCANLSVCMGYMQH